jgi:hypothetical protein
MRRCLSQCPVASRDGDDGDVGDSSPARALGWERDDWKRDVRTLEELGLRQSLEVGYRLSPRGAAFLAATR